MHVERQSRRSECDPVVPVSDAGVTMSSSHDPTISLIPNGAELNSTSFDTVSSRDGCPVETVTSVSDSGGANHKEVKLNSIKPSTEDLNVKHSDQDTTFEDDHHSSTDDCSPAAKRPRLDPSSLGTEGKDTSVQHKDRSSDSALSSVDSMGQDAVIMVCNVTLRKVDLHVKLEMSWVDGQNRELMHQLLQYFKNRFV